MVQSFFLVPSTIVARAKDTQQQFPVVIEEMQLRSRRNDVG